MSRLPTRRITLDFIKEEPGEKSVFNVRFQEPLTAVTSLKLTHVFFQGVLAEDEIAGTGVEDPYLVVQLDIPGMNSHTLAMVDTTTVSDVSGITVPLHTDSEPWSVLTRPIEFIQNRLGGVEISNIRVRVKRPFLTSAADSPAPELVSDEPYFKRLVMFLEAEQEHTARFVEVDRRGVSTDAYEGHDILGQFQEHRADIVRRRAAQYTGFN